jgi:ABC-type multidrug transport system fused ATPase/permease subunit
VSFENVTFGYSDDAAIFKNTSFSVEKGGITAIAGTSGCGKSTALKLMLGLYKADGGQISLSSENITYVPQDCCLLPVSIRENVLGGLPLDDEKLRGACENAGIYSFIQSLSDGFDSVLTESAANVSGGQKQRLAMARAFYRNADILLLDEATSALDPITEQAVLEAFRRYIKDYGKTAVVVAHRQAVLEMSDRIITLGREGTG